MTKESADKCLSSDIHIYINTQTGILFSQEKEQSSAICDMNETKKHFAKWKNPDIQTTYYMSPFIWNIQNRQIIHRNRKVEGCLGGSNG